MAAAWDDLGRCRARGAGGRGQGEAGGRRRTAALATAATALLTACAPLPLPPQPAAERVVWLDQNWSAEQRRWFHHTSQGTATLPVPVQWFMALEQPTIAWTGMPGLFSEAAYLRRWGFIDSTPGPDNPGGLPVGFAIDRGHHDPASGRVFDAVGLSCAACHTAQLRYRGTTLRIDGGPALADVASMSEALGAAVAFTKLIPGRFGRFAERVLGAEATPEQRDRLAAELQATLAKLKQLKAMDDAVRPASVAEGYSRLDALTRIGNQVFAVDAGKPANYHATDAPVNFPHIWTSSWFSWVQYDGSIMQPMVRNAGEALGVVAGLDLSGPPGRRFASSVPVDTLDRIERQLAGPEHPLAQQRFTGLTAPHWPEALLGAIDAAKAAQGQALYAQHCQRCHLPAPDSAAFWDRSHWTRLGSGAQASEQAYLKLAIVPISVVGTDPAQASALADRKVDTTGIGLNAVLWAPDAAQGNACAPLAAPFADNPAAPYGPALGALVQQTVAHWYDEHGTPPAQRRQMDGDRPNCLMAVPAYRARPLNGVWATAPFLHNGSVPDLFALLSPANERPARFILGNPEFDPQRVGYQSGHFPGGFELDTAQPGNSNRGHEFDTAPPFTRGVIGPRLSPEERWALVEYLKTL